MLNRNVLKRAATVAAGNLFVGGLLFLAAGTWNHFYAWVFVVTLFIVDLTGIPFLSPELLAERGKKKSDAEKWDIALTRWIVISSMSIFTVSGLDYRFFSNVVRIQYDRGQTVVTGGAIQIYTSPRLFGNDSLLSGGTCFSRIPVGTDSRDTHRCFVCDPYTPGRQDASGKAGRIPGLRASNAVPADPEDLVTADLPGWQEKAAYLYFSTIRM